MKGETKKKKKGKTVNVCLGVCDEEKSNHTFQQAWGEDNEEPNRWEHFCLKADQEKADNTQFSPE